MPVILVGVYLHTAGNRQKTGPIECFGALWVRFVLRIQKTVQSLGFGQPMQVVGV